MIHCYKNTCDALFRCSWSLTRATSCQTIFPSSSPGCFHPSTSPRSSCSSSSPGFFLQSTSLRSSCSSSPGCFHQSTSLRSSCSSCTSSRSSCSRSHYPRTAFWIRTAKNQYRKLETNIPRKDLRGHSPIFHNHVSVSDIYIPTVDLPMLLEEICGLILGIYKSLTDT
jgi:hypothetical protein